MEDMEMECESYTVCYCVVKAQEHLDPTIWALKRHSSATADDVPVGTPLGDVVTRIKWDKGVSDVYWLKDSQWKNVTDKHLVLSFPKGVIVYLKFVKVPRATTHQAAVSAFANLGPVTEGLVAREGRYTSRNSAIEKLLQLVQQKGAVLIQAPPQSGKTSFLQLAYRKAQYLPNWEAVYFINLATVNDISFKEFLKLTCDVEVVDLIGPGGPKRLLLVDEAQTAFGRDLVLWKTLKQVQGGYQEHSPNLNIILSSDYGAEDVPGAMIPVWWDTFNRDRILLKPSGDHGLSLQFSDEEAVDLWLAWMGYYRFPDLGDELRDWIIRLSDKMPGVMTGILDWLADTGIGTKRPSTLSEYFVRKLQTTDLTFIFANCRSIQSFYHKIDSPGAYRSLLTCLLANIEMSHDWLSQEMQDAVHELLLCGQLMKNKRGNYCLPSKVHERFYSRRIYKGILSVAEVGAMGIKLFLVRVLECFSSKALRNSFSRGRQDEEDTTPYERHLEMEFYRSVCSLLDPDICPCPDMGPPFGVKGFADYYLARFGWFFELMRKGTETTRHLHLGRFRQNGRYWPLFTGPLKAYVIIGIANEVEFVDNMPDKDGTYVFAVTFASDFKTAIVFPDGLTAHLTNDF